MNTKIKKIITTLTTSFEGEPWFGDSLMTKLHSIDDTLVNHTLPNSKNSIAILVQHLINWRRFTIEKLNNNASFDIKMNSEEDWTRITIKTKPEWIALIDTLTSTQKELIEILKQQNDDFLERLTPGRVYNFEFLIEGIIQHDIYHHGQIGFLYSQIKRETL